MLIFRDYKKVTKSLSEFKRKNRKIDVWFIHLWWNIFWYLEDVLIFRPVKIKIN